MSGEPDAMDEPLMRATPVDAVEGNSTTSLCKKDAPEESKPHRYVIAADRSRDRRKQHRRRTYRWKGNSKGGGEKRWDQTRFVPRGKSGDVCERRLNLNKEEMASWG